MVRDPIMELKTGSRGVAGSAGEMSINATGRRYE
jgi:hypothetical protein